MQHFGAVPQCIEQQELKAERGEQARETISSENGRLCATPFGVDVVGITEVVALTGALVGGATLSRACGLFATTSNPALPIKLCSHQADQEVSL